MPLEGCEDGGAQRPEPARDDAERQRRDPVEAHDQARVDACLQDRLILGARARDYAKADHVVDTSGLTVEDALERLLTVVQTS